MNDRVEPAADIGAEPLDAIVSQTRVDAPHRPADAPTNSATAHNATTSAEATSPSPAATDTKLDPSFALLAALDQSQLTTAEPVLIQASQLANHLRTTKSEVEQCQTELNARVAELESEAREAQQWADQRNYELAQREQQQIDHVDELEQRAAELAAAEISADRRWDDREEELNQLSCQLTEQQEELVRQQRQLEKQQAALRHAETEYRESRRRQQDADRAEQQQFTTWRNEQSDQLNRLHRNVEKFRETLDRREHRISERYEEVMAAHDNASQQQWQVIVEQLDQREAALDESEVNLREQQAVLKSEWNQLQEQRQEIDAKLRSERREMAEQRRQVDGAQAVRRIELDERTQRVEEQWSVVQQLREDVLKMHRDALEMRLVTEQLWTSCNRQMSPEQATQAIAVLRRKLAEQLLLEQRSLDERRAEIEGLVERLDERRDKFVEERNELCLWKQQREAEIEEQAARLVAREQELATCEKQFRADRRKWEAERRQLVDQIERLTTRQRPTRSAA